MKKLIIILAILAGLASTSKAIMYYVNPETGMMDVVCDGFWYITYDVTNYELDVSTSVNITGDFTITGKISAGTGTEAAPSYTFTGLEDTGMYASGANSLDFAVNGNQVLSINPTETVIVGNLEPFNGDTSDLGHPGWKWRNFFLSGDASIDGETQLGNSSTAAGTSVGIGIAPIDTTKLKVVIGGGVYNPANDVTGFGVEARTGGGGARGNATYGFQGLLTVGGTGNNTAVNYCMQPSVLIRDSGDKNTCGGILSRVDILGGQTTNIDFAINYNAQIDANDGSFDIAYNYHGTTPLKNGGGAITTFAHIWLQDVGAAPTTGWAIYSEGGDSFLTDKLFFGQTDGTIGIYSQANSFLDLFADGAVRIGDSSAGAPTNYTEFESDGTIRFNGAATVFNDIVVPLSSARVPASNAPSWVSFIGNLNAYTYGLNDFQEFSTELAHSYKDGSTIQFHVHGAVNGSNVDERKIKFEIEYTIADIPPENGFGDVYPVVATPNGELTIPASTTDLTAFSIDIGDDTTGNFVQGAIVKGRVRRIASTGTEPTSDPFLTEVGIHIESDTIGTRTATAK